MQSQTEIGLTTYLQTDYESAVHQVTEALKAEGFGVLTEIDVKDTLKKKLDIEFQPYKILGACNPALAHRALSNAPDVGLLLPCNVTITQLDDHRIQVSIADPLMLTRVVDNDALQPIAEAARDHMDRVIAALES